MTGRGLAPRAAVRGLPSSLMLLLVVSAASACSPAGNPDAPVSSVDEPVGPATTMTQGAVGRITDESGAPLYGAFLQLRPLDPGAPAMPDIAVVSGEDGRFLYALPPGGYDITVVLEGYEPATRRMNVLPGEVVPLDFVMQQGPQQP